MFENPLTRRLIYDALSTILLVPLIYLVFMQAPFKERMLLADTAFIKVDYSSVIDTLTPVSTDDLPYTQKYELAYSYIKNLGFASDKEKVILNNVTLKTEEVYLDYWIEVGRGDYDQALDLGKRLNDSDLILYALAMAMEQVRSDSSLSGEKREEQLETLQKSYDSYWDKRQTALMEDEASEASETQAPADDNKEDEA